MVFDGGAVLGPVASRVIAAQGESKEGGVMTASLFVVQARGAAPAVVGAGNGNERGKVGRGEEGGGVGVGVGAGKKSMELQESGEGC